MGDKMRLDKLLCDCGKGTRSEVKNYIKKGLVSVNGDVVKSGDIKVDTIADVVCFEGREVYFERYVYYMLHKPAGVVSATEDRRDKTVIELITEDKPRDLFPVGRLDKDTEGLLIITNDGKLSNSMLSPKKHVDKTYYAKIEKKQNSEESDLLVDDYGNENIISSEADKNDKLLISEHIIRQFEEGLDIGDEKLTAPARLKVISQTECYAEIEITITEGRYHQVKRMFEAVGMTVTYLKRLSMGGLVLDEGLGLGEYRRLTDAEIEILKTGRRN